MNVLENLQTGAPIFALAVSADETLIAYGGAAPAAVTVWDLSRGALVAQLTGFTGQVEALAFSADAALIAAANVWGGLWVWQVKDGQLLHHKAPGKSRRKRSLAFTGVGKNKTVPVMLSAALYGSTTRLLAPNGQFLATLNGSVRITQYNCATELAYLNLQQYELAKAGARSLNWSGDSTWLAFAGDGWAGAWLHQAATFWGCRLPTAEFIFALAVLRSTRQIVYSTGGTKLCSVTLPDTPWQTNWEAQFARLLAEAQAEMALPPPQDWTWNVTQWGYEGVTLEAEGLLWYSHSHNTLAGGGANAQSLTSFLADGPADSTVPEDVLSKLCQAVQRRLTELRGPAPDASGTSQSEP